MQAHFDYGGCNVFVAGGTSGINLGIARAFAAAGARLGVGSRRQEKVDAAVAVLGGAGGPALGYTFDVRDPAAVASAIAAFAGEAGAIDVLVSGAAGNFPALAHQISPNGFKAVIDIDVLGTWHVMKAAYPHMKKPGGSLINISAPQASVPMALPGARLRRQGGGRHDHPLPRHRMGAGGPAGERRGPRPHRRHRGHGAAGAEPGAAGRRGARGAHGADSARPRTWPGRASGSARRRRPTSTASSSPPTAAGR